MMMRLYYRVGLPSSDPYAFTDGFVECEATDFAQAARLAARELIRLGPRSDATFFEVRITGTDR